MLSNVGARAFIKVSLRGPLSNESFNIARTQITARSKAAVECVMKKFYCKHSFIIRSQIISLLHELIIFSFSLYIIVFFVIIEA